MSNQYINDVTENIKAMRLKRKTLNLGVREAARQIGISPATYSRIEREHNMAVSSYVKILKWLR